MPLIFEWDTEKAETNIQKHGKLRGGLHYLRRPDVDYYYRS